MDTEAGKNGHELVATSRAESPGNLHPIVRAVLAQTSDPTALRELLAVQREWEADCARRAFNEALAALKRVLPTVIAKDKVVDYQSAKGRTRYTHSSLAKIIEEIEGPLSENGFSHSWSTTNVDCGVKVTCRLTHVAGHFTETSLEGPYDDSGGKNKIQAIGSSVTYLQRYTLMALLGITTADVDDADDPPWSGPGSRSTALADVLAAIQSARDETALRATSTDAAKLGASEKEIAKAAYIKRAAELGIKRQPKPAQHAANASGSKGGAA